MKILKIFPDNPNERHIDYAVDSLLDGNVIIYPTDTLYAFGCDALNNSAVGKICELKKLRTDKISLSIICSDIAQAAEYARIDNDAFRLLKENLPGPFTFILPASNKLPKLFKGRKEVGIRIPANEVALAVVRRLGHPIMTASIPIVDEETSTEPDYIAALYENSVDLIIDAGRGGIEPSTIVDCTSDTPTLIRQGKGEIDLDI